MHVPHRRSHLFVLLLPLLAIGAAGCSDAAPAPASGGGGPGVGPTQVKKDGPVELPFLVSDEFVASGYMGNSEGAMSGIKMSASPGDCKMPRPADAAGSCFTIGWTPALSGDPGSSWAGVYWQSSANNWGANPGKKIAPGATKVTFYAAGSGGGEKVEFRVGGVNVKGDDPSLTYRDSFTVSKEIALTTSWEKYEISLAGTAYDEVLGGFAWNMTTTDRSGVTFYVDNIRWEM